MPIEAWPRRSCTTLCAHYDAGASSDGIPYSARSGSPAKLQEARAHSPGADGRHSVIEADLRHEAELLARLLSRVGRRQRNARDGGLRESGRRWHEPPERLD